MYVLDYYSPFFPPGFDYYFNYYDYYFNYYDYYFNFPFGLNYYDYYFDFPFGLNYYDVPMFKLCLNRKQRHILNKAFKRAFDKMESIRDLDSVLYSDDEDDLV